MKQFTIHTARHAFGIFTINGEDEPLALERNDAQKIVTIYSIDLLNGFPPFAFDIDDDQRARLNTFKLDSRDFGFDSIQALDAAMQASGVHEAAERLAQVQES